MPVATPRVGARMEEVAPRKVGDVSDWVRIVALAGVSVALHGWLLANTYVTARDSIGFARYALQLENPAAIKHPDGTPFTMTDVLRPPTNQHPPGYPLAVLLTSKVVRLAYQPGGPPEYQLACQMLLSAQIASCLAAVLLVAPSYWLGRMLFGKFAGFAAALLFQVLPVAAHVTADGLTEGLFLLTLGTALLLGTRAIKNPGIGGSLLCGLAGGLTYLVRPEGLAAVAAVGLVMVGMAAVRRWPRRATAARITALGVGVMIPAAPYMALIGGVTGKASGKSVWEKLNIRSPKEGVTENRNDGPALFAAWYDKEKDGSLPAWVVKAIAKETFKTFHYVPAVLAVFGLAVAVRRLRAEPWVWVPILFMGMMLALLGALAYIGQMTPSNTRQHYVSERHTLSIVYVGCFFAAGGLVELTRRIKHPAAPAVVLAALVASCLPSAVRPLHENRAGHKHIGEVLRDQAGPDDTIIDPWDWAQWYAGRTLVWIHQDPEPLAGRYRWAVLEPGDDPNSESPRYPMARAVAADQENKAEVIARWPEDAPLEKAKVVLYRQRITAADEARWRAEKARNEAEAARKAAEK